MQHKNHMPKGKHMMGGKMMKGMNDKKKGKRRGK